MSLFAVVVLINALRLRVGKQKPLVQSTVSSAGVVKEVYR
jgi:hypothetical protein